MPEGAPNDCRLSLAELLRTVTPEVEVTHDALVRASVDTSLFTLMPQAVVYPRTTKEVAQLARLATAHRGTFTLTARAAGTDMTGGPLTTSVVLDVTRHLNTIHEVHPEGEGGWAWVEPGTYYRDFERATLAAGLLLPCYTASRDLNTLGGMVGNNSGGEKSLRYGKMERFVEELEVVLASGEIVRFRRLSAQEWRRRAACATHEGRLYRTIGPLIREHWSLIQARRPRVTKNSAGYALWNVWNPTDDSLDLAQLIVGSQGTLGVVTNIKVRLVRPAPHAVMLVMFLRPHHMEALGELVTTVLRYEPESFESYDRHTLSVALHILPDLLRRLGGSVFALARDFVPELRLVLTGGLPHLVLLAEFAGDDRQALLATARQAGRDVRRQFGVVTHVTERERERQKYWLIRRESFKLLREHVHHLHTAPFIDDIAVDPRELPSFLPRLYQIMDRYNLLYTIAGHIGDGNFHIIPLVDLGRPDLFELITRLSEEVYDLVIAHRGTTTGEHNDGIVRTPYLAKLYGPEVVALFQRVKDVFDPYRILNPHKKVDVDPTLMRRALIHPVRA